MNEELNTPWNSVDTEADKLRKELKLRNAEIAEMRVLLEHFRDLVTYINMLNDANIEWRKQAKQDSRPSVMSLWGMLIETEDKIRKLMEEGK